MALVKPKADNRKLNIPSRFHVLLEQFMQYLHATLIWPDLFSYDCINIFNHMYPIPRVALVASTHDDGPQGTMSLRGTGPGPPASP